jgi:hypothetical protein
MYTNVNPQFSENSHLTTSCDSNNLTVMGLLQDIAKRVNNIEVLLGASNTNVVASTLRRTDEGTGIDIVLGAQWGDEGKGKLVDILSQVSFGLIFKLN